MHYQCLLAVACNLARYMQRQQRQLCGNLKDTELNVAVSKLAKNPPRMRSGAVVLRGNAACRRLDGKLARQKPAARTSARALSQK
jgi:hypothetical protein